MVGEDVFGQALLDNLTSASVGIAAVARVSGPSGAAARLGMPRSTLESKIRSLKINKRRFQSADPSA